MKKILFFLANKNKIITFERSFEWTGFTFVFNGL